MFTTYRKKKDFLLGFFPLPTLLSQINIRHNAREGEGGWAMAEEVEERWECDSPSPTGWIEENTTCAPDPFNIILRDTESLLRDLCQMLIHCCPTSSLKNFPDIILPAYIAPLRLLFPGPVLLSGTINLNLGYQIKHEWIDRNILMLFLPSDVPCVTQEAHLNPFLQQLCYVT